MDKKLMQIVLNLEYFEVEYFLWVFYGYGFDKVVFYFVDGGFVFYGVQKVNLDLYYNDFFF